jgi:hypothetical protein
MDRTVYLHDHTMHGARRWRAKMLNRGDKNNIITIYLIAETSGKRFKSRLETRLDDLYV